MLESPFVCVVRLSELLDLAFVSNSSLVERRDLGNDQKVTTPVSPHQSHQRAALLTGNVRRGQHRGAARDRDSGTYRTNDPSIHGVPRRYLSQNGRTWDRTRDLSRVKRALSR